MSSRIQVCVRLRPDDQRDGIDVVFKEEDPASAYLDVITPLKRHHTKQSGNNSDTAAEQQRIRFRFDRILDESFDQEEIFQVCGEPFVQDFFCGYNGAILAYGQTGSGKTYAIMGPPEGGFEQRGLAARVLTMVFDEAERRRSDPFHPQDVSLRMSALEIYNETLVDLLLDHHQQQQDELAIYEGKDGTTIIPKLSTPEVSTEEEGLHLLFAAHMNRAMGTHELNQGSTRSHCIYTLHLTIRPSAEAVAAGATKLITAKLHLVDLAGSERIFRTKSVGVLQKEAGYINKSLSFLEQVVVALTDEKREHIPFRSSKLTHFLKDSLGGNCRTLLIACIWPVASHADQTLSTLRFSTRMMSIKNAPVINSVSIEPSTAYTAHLEKQIKALKDELSALQARLLLQEHAEGGNRESHDEEQPLLLRSHNALTAAQLETLQNQVSMYVMDEANLQSISTAPQIKATYSHLRHLIWESCQSCPTRVAALINRPTYLPTPTEEFISRRSATSTIDEKKGERQQMQQQRGLLLREEEEARNQVYIPPSSSSSARNSFSSSHSQKSSCSRPQTSSSFSSSSSCPTSRPSTTTSTASSTGVTALEEAIESRLQQQPLFINNLRDNDDNDGGSDEGTQQPIEFFTSEEDDDQSGKHVQQVEEEEEQQHQQADEKGENREGDDDSDREILPSPTPAIPEERGGGQETQRKLAFVQFRKTDLGTKDANALKSIKLAQKQVKERIDELCAALRELGLIRQAKQGGDDEEEGKGKAKGGKQPPQVKGIEEDLLDLRAQQQRKGAGQRPQVKDIEEDLLELRAQQQALMDQKNRAVRQLVQNFKSWWAAAGTCSAPSAASSSLVDVPIGVPPSSGFLESELTLQEDHKQQLKRFDYILDNDGDNNGKGRQLCRRDLSLPPLGQKKNCSFIDAGERRGDHLFHEEYSSSSRSNNNNGLPAFSSSTTRPAGGGRPPLALASDSSSGKQQQQQQQQQQHHRSSSSVSQIAYEMARCQALESRGGERRRRRGKGGTQKRELLIPASAISRYQQRRRGEGGGLSGEVTRRGSKGGNNNNDIDSRDRVIHASHRRMLTT